MDATPARTRTLPHRVLSVVAALGLGALIVVGAPAQRAEAAAPATPATPTIEHPLVPVSSGTQQTDGAEFDPGLIISDYNFYNSAAMTEEQVEEFLFQMRCTPRDDSPCLRDYRQDTTTQPAEEAGHCAVYRGARNESAARIITRVADACGVSPRVLLVLLQKEQSLVTRPNASGYLRAAGYGCPDTADCDTKYFGFFNQVYNAAWQFRQYTQHPDRAFQIGAVPVRFHPNADCGTSVVEIGNQATANLYNYTPYQPNPAALADLEADGDACSAFGNLNFWKLYSKWFGDPSGAPYPTIFGPCANIAGGQRCAAPEWQPAR